MAKNSQAHVDPEQLRALASELATWSSKVTDLGRELESGLSRLGDTFRDDHYHDFRAMFQASLVKLEQFAAETKAVVPTLRRDADDIAASQSTNLER